MSQNILCSWSGGKDSCFALMSAKHVGYIPKVLLNVLNEDGKISRSHGIPADILQAQSDAASLPIHLIASSWQEYEKHFTTALNELKIKYQLSCAVFGDIDLQAHRDWEEKVCTNAGLKAVLPLWQQDRKELVLQMFEAGIETMIVSCNEMMGEKFIGQMITPDLIEKLECLGIDACGENGEYHTLVLHAPVFKNRIQVKITEAMRHDHYWFGKMELI